MFAVKGVAPALALTKLNGFPFPLAGIPIEGKSFVHAKVVPDVKLVKFTAAMVVPAHSEIGLIGCTCGMG